jgi:hypothetical protein
VWKRIVRFVAEDGQEYCGEPSEAELDGIHQEICELSVKY